jgi:hypothetical protein
MGTRATQLDGERGACQATADDRNLRLRHL